jgi:hypothetical protein
MLKIQLQWPPQKKGCEWDFHTLPIRESFWFIMWDLTIACIKIWVNHWSLVNQILGTNSLWGGKKKKKIWTVVGGHYTSAIVVVTIVPQCCSEWLLSCPSLQYQFVSTTIRSWTFFPTSIFMHVKFISWSHSCLLSTKLLKRLQPKVQMESKWTFFL